MKLFDMKPRERNLEILNRMRDRENRYGLGPMGQIERIYRELLEIQAQDKERHQMDSLGHPFDEWLEEAIDILDQIVNYDPTE
jgi:hypothetical protein